MRTWIALLTLIIFSSIASMTILEESVLRGSVLTLEIHSPVISAVMWSFSNVWERALMFRIIAPSTEDYVISGSMSIISAESNSIAYYSEFKSVERLTANTDTLVVVILPKEITIQPFEFLRGDYYIRIHVTVEPNNYAREAIFSWIPRKLTRSDVIIVPSSYDFEIRYLDTCLSADFLWKNMTYGVYFKGSLYSFDILYVSAVVSGNSFKISSDVVFNDIVLRSDYYDGSYYVIFENIGLKPSYTNRINVLVSLEGI